MNDVRCCQSRAEVIRKKKKKVALLDSKTSACPPVRLSVCPPVRLYACTIVRLSAGPPVRLSACPPVRRISLALGQPNQLSYIILDFPNSAMYSTTTTTTTYDCDFPFSIWMSVKTKISLQSTKISTSLAYSSFLWPYPM